jgi:hypothetical protein
MMDYLIKLSLGIAVIAIVILMGIFSPVIVVGQLIYLKVTE